MNELRKCHPMFAFLLDMPLIWPILVLLPGGCFLFVVEYESRFDGYPAGLPWPISWSMGIAFCGITVIGLSLLGLPLWQGFVIAKALGVAHVIFAGWRDRAWEPNIH